MHPSSNRIYFTETTDNLTLVILSGLKPIVRSVYSIISIFSTGLFFLMLYNSLFDGSIILGVLCLIPAVASITLIKMVSRKEIININRTEISITQKDFIETKFKSYLLSDISHLHYAGENEFTPHSIGQNNFDYMGIQTSEKELQNFIKDGTLEFFYQGTRVRFGMGVFSWDAEEIISRIEKFAGSDLQLDDSMKQLLNHLKNVDNQEE